MYYIQKLKYISEKYLIKVKYTLSSKTLIRIKNDAINRSLYANLISQIQLYGF